MCADGGLELELFLTFLVPTWGSKMFPYELWIGHHWEAMVGALGDAREPPRRTRLEVGEHFNLWSFTEDLPVILLQW